MKAFLSLAIFFALSVAVFADQNQFLQWMRENNRVYSSDSEYSLRYANFMQNVRLIEEQNTKKESLEFGLNKFSDMSAAEFKQKVLMKVTEPVELPASAQGRPFVSAPNAPTSFDWRSRGAVTPVKDQGQCGSCWAFSATEAIESGWILKGHATSSSINLSPQQIVDCDTTDAGCNGGWPEKAMAYVRQAGGQEGIAHYPYTAKNGVCNFVSAYVEAKIAGSEPIGSKGDETTLQNQLVNLGPLSICVDASKWQNYKSGVMTHTQCCATTCSLDHCVQLVGYNANVTTPYWIVRNSWNTNWGVQGYIYLGMGGNTCGLTNHVTWPLY